MSAAFLTRPAAERQVGTDRDGHEVLGDLPAPQRTARQGSPAFMTQPANVPARVQGSVNAATPLTALPLRSSTGKATRVPRKTYFG